MACVTGSSESVSGKSAVGAELACFAEACCGWRGVRVTWPAVIGWEVESLVDASVEAIEGMRLESVSEGCC